MTTSILPAVNLYVRPAFINDLSNAYTNREKRVVVLSGDTRDQYWSKEQQQFFDLNRILSLALTPLFHVLRLDIATGLSTVLPEDAKALHKDVARAEALTSSKPLDAGAINQLFEISAGSPLASLRVLRQLMQSIETIRGIDTKVKPVCVVVQFAGSLFPQGEYDKLSEIDRQRLVAFLSMVESPGFTDTKHLVILVASTASEVNSKISLLPSCQNIVVDLPNDVERRKYVEFHKGFVDVKFEGGLDSFLTVTAGLPLTSLHNLLESARRTKQEISKKEVLDEINTMLRTELGDIISLVRPEHTPDDIIGYAGTTMQLHAIFERCKDPEKAVPVILSAGANGAGKSYQMEAHAAASGRVVIELKNLRSMWYGQTDVLFEKLRSIVRVFGSLLILVDEAHTAFGSVHKSDTQDTEKRLAGNVIKMMSDKTLLGKILWVLMTSRPDELDPDVKSRAACQIPIFDTEGDDRKAFVTELFRRKKIACDDAELEEVLKITKSYSNRDYDFLIREIIGSGKSPTDSLAAWSATNAIGKQRRLQTLLAAKHCSYPGLLPAEFKGKVGEPEFEGEIVRLMTELRY